MSAAALPTSPCILVCAMDRADRWCLGCYRTRDEIARWGGAGADERRAILAATAARSALR